MANVIKLHKGLNINLKGKPAQEFFDVKQPDIYAIVPDDFHGVIPCLQTLFSYLISWRDS